MVNCSGGPTTEIAKPLFVKIVAIDFKYSSPDFKSGSNDSVVQGLNVNRTHVGRYVLCRLLGDK